MLQLVRTTPRHAYPVRARPTAAREGGRPFKPGRVRDGILALRSRFGSPLVTLGTLAEGDQNLAASRADTVRRAKRDRPI